jgi:undecaprenyl-diphosphatase
VAQVEGSAPKVAPQVEAVKSAAPIVLAGFALVFGSLIVFGVLAEGVRSQEVYALDRFANPFLHGLASPALDAVMESATFIGSNVVLIPLALVVCPLLLVVRQVREAFFVVLAIGGSLLLNGVLKPFFERPRPQLPWAQVLPDYSFPSGHAMNSLALFVALAVVAWHLWGRRVGVPAVIAAAALVLVIGVSRIYLGYHYLTDVVAGFAASLIWLTVVAGALGAGERARSRWWRTGGKMSESR